MYLSFHWFNDLWIWTRNSWIWTRSSWIWTRTSEFQLVFLNFELVFLSFQLVTRNSCLTISRNNTRKEFLFGLFHANSYKRLTRHWTENISFTRNEISCKYIISVEGGFSQDQILLWKKNAGNAITQKAHFRVFLKKFHTS